MFNRRVFFSKGLVFPLIAAFALLVFPHEALAADPVGSMMGYIFAADAKTPQPGAVVKLRNAVDGREYQSLPTDKEGLYRIKDLPEGTYILGVSGAKGDFNFDYQIQIKANEIARLALALREGAPAGGPASEGEGKRKSFFLTPLGIAAIVAVAGVLVWGAATNWWEGDKSPTKK